MGKYFGTDGFRGVANITLTSLHAYRIGRFIGQYPLGHKNKILIARDTRLSGHMLSDALISGIISSGGDVINLSVFTTPSISYLVQKNKFDFGVMISASHNPYYDNGIKIFNTYGEKLSENIETLIEQYIDNIDDDLPRAVNENLGKYLSSDGYKLDYLSYLKSKATRDFSSLKILIDCANGSSSEAIPQLVKMLSLNATIINYSPNGVNINDRCGSTHIANLKDKVIEGNFDIAFAFDGDADRCLAINRNGEIIDGDAIMYLCATNLKKHHLLKDDTIVLTVMSNLGLKIALKKNGISIKEVGVGDKYVQSEMKQNGYVLGGEQSGHIIFLNDLNTGSGLLTMIKVLNIISEENKDITELLKDLKIYPQSLKNIVVTNKEAVLSHQGFNELISQISDELNGEGRILVRASGTEPLIRVMCEAKEQRLCDEICDRLINYVSEMF